MKKIAHISDLHFNRIDVQIARSVKRAILESEPDLLVISGDLTQRARVKEFKAFREFIADIPVPKIIVPGNHDIPLFNLAERFISPLARYRKHVQADLTPVYEDDEMFVIGVNSVRPYAMKGGYLSQAQLDEIEHRFDLTDPKKVRVLVCHHSLQNSRKWSWDAVRGIDQIDTRVDLVLSGHLHQADCEVLPIERMTRTGLNASTLLVRAGTAFSTDHRGEPNSFNLITIENRQVDVKVLHWAATPPGLSLTHQLHYLKERGRWFHA